MIIEVIFEMVKILLTSVLGILPDIPPVPVVISDAVDYLLVEISRAMQYISEIFGYAFSLVVAGCLLIMLTFNQIYHLVMWIIRKLPIGAQ